MSAPDQHYPFQHHGEGGELLGQGTNDEGIRDDERQPVPTPRLAGGIPDPGAGEAGSQLDVRPVYVYGEFPKDPPFPTSFVLPVGD